MSEMERQVTLFVNGGDGTAASPVVLLRLLNDRARAPEFRSEGAAGADIFSSKETILQKSDPTRIHTGIALSMSQANLFAHLMPRSSTVFRHAITVTHGVIDRDYVREIFVIGTYFGPEATYTLPAGTEIAQLSFHEVIRPSFRKVDCLPSTSRGAGGFGSTDAARVSSVPSSSSSSEESEDEEAGVIVISSDSDDDDEGTIPMRGSEGDNTEELDLTLLDGDFAHLPDLPDLSANLEDSDIIDLIHEDLASISATSKK